MSQPSLSKAVMKLEDELGVTLLNRTNKGIKMTSQGRELYQYAKTILDQVNLIDGIKEQKNRRFLSVASYPIISISEILAEFYTSHNSDEITVNLMEGRLQNTIENVERGKADIGFLLINNMQAKDIKKILKHKNLEFKLIGYDTWYANVGPGSPLYHKSSVTASELLRYPIVRIGEDHYSYLTQYMTIDGVSLASYKQGIFVNDNMGLVNMLYHTNVFRFGPGLSNENFKKFGIKSIPIRNCDVEVAIGWIKKKDRILNDSAMEFSTLLEEWVRGELSKYPTVIPKVNKFM